jgi:colanic acid/amylovoran/stewartan biosynthesis glycosyltransferase WcaL/AmsK/CpsK
MRERLLALGVPADTIRIHRIGVDLDKVPFETKRFSPQLRVVMIGRFVEKKGLVDGLHACAGARAHGLDLTVTIVGDAVAHHAVGLSIKRELQQIAASPPLAGAVTFTGFQALHETRALLRSCNVFLCPSKHASDGDAEGGSPVVLTEAMAMGLLCVGTSHCDIPAVILNGDTGYVVAEGDRAALAQCLITIAQNPDRAEVISRAGRKHIENCFRLETQLEGLALLYRLAM